MQSRSRCLANSLNENLVFRLVVSGSGKCGYIGCSGWSGESKGCREGGVPVVSVMRQVRASSRDLHALERRCPCRYRRQAPSVSVNGGRESLPSSEISPPTVPSL